MKVYAPEYYEKFNCIAEKCKHNCCIGWEIDIDETSLKKYEDLKTPFACKVCENIEYEPTAHFKLKDSDRCAFLNEYNLCEIIINLGKGSLCDICAEHPRFRNYYSDRVEVGLGLCCEEASRIILSDKRGFSLVYLEDYENEDCYNFAEEEFFLFREKCIDKFSDQSMSIYDRIFEFAQICRSKTFNKSIDEWVEIFCSLEEMDPVRGEILSDIKKYVSKDSLHSFIKNADECFANLALYFIYRHFAKYFEGYSVSDVANFVLLCLISVMAMCVAEYEKSKSLSFESIVEYARIFSSEIEYSEENTYALLEMCALED